jgi:hypothetical protein
MTPYTAKDGHDGDRCRGCVTALLAHVPERTHILAGLVSHIDILSL